MVVAPSVNQTDPTGHRIVPGSSTFDCFEDRNIFLRWFQGFRGW